MNVKKDLTDIRAALKHKTFVLYLSEPEQHLRRITHAMQIQGKVSVFTRFGWVELTDVHKLTLQ